MLILLAEDSKTLSLALRRKFESMGHQVALAEDGQAAVDWFASGHPDLVVMDIDMPRMNGFEAAQKIRAIERKAGDESSWTPIIFLTATDTVQNLLAAIEAGGDDFLPKTAPEAVLGAKLAAMGRISALIARLKCLSRENKTLTSEAFTDAMTLLPNRRSLDAKLNELSTLNQGQISLGVLMIDVDHFKEYNDKLGHGAGDVCLARVGSALSMISAQEEGVFAARYGGEEFAILITPCDRNRAMRLAQAVVDHVRALALPHPGNAGRSVVSVSVGAAQLDALESCQNVFRRADQALYAAKANGRSRAEWDTPALG